MVRYGWFSDNFIFNNIKYSIMAKNLMDRLESKVFTINLIGVTSTIFFLIILLLVVIFSRENLDKVFNLLYLLAGLILGIFGRKSIENVTTD